MVSGCGFLCFEKQKKNLTQKSLRTWITDHRQQIRLSKRWFCDMDLLPCAGRNQNKQEDKTVLIPTPLLWRFVIRVTRSEFRKFPLFHLKAINRIFPRPNKVFLAQQTCYQAGAGEHHFWSSCRSLNCVKTLTHSTTVATKYGRDFSMQKSIRDDCSGSLATVTTLSASVAAWNFHIKCHQLPVLTLINSNFLPNTRKGKTMQNTGENIWTDRALVKV